MKKEAINIIEGRWDIIQSELHDKESGWYGFLDIYIEECYNLECIDKDKNIYYLSLINDPDCPPPFFRYLIMGT